MIVYQSTHRKQGDAVFTVPIVRSIERLKNELPPTENTSYIMDSGYAGEKQLQSLADLDLYVPDHKLAHDEAGMGGKTRPEDRDSLKPKALSPRYGLDVHLNPGEKIPFRYSREEDAFQCPAGRTLTKRRDRTLQHKSYSVYRTGGCALCALRSYCAGASNKRKDLMIETVRLPHLAVYYGRPRLEEPGPTHTELMRRKLLTPAGRRMYAKRMPTSEGVFGTMLGPRNGGRFMRRSLERVAVEWTERAIAHNIARLVGFTQ